MSDSASPPTGGDRYEAAEPTTDLIVVGGGPTGLACAIEATKAGLSVRVIEKGAVVDAIRRFPIDMRFFTTRERLEIGGLPMTIPDTKPTRSEALAYYRAAARHFDLDVRSYERVAQIAGQDGEFGIEVRDRFDRVRRYRARKVVIATGYFDHPNLLGVPGEDLSHVRHYFRDVHEAAGLPVVIVGGGNSAAEAALDLARAGAKVTIVLRKAHFDPAVKYWVLPDIENRIQEGMIAGRFETHVTGISERAVRIEGEDGAEDVPAAFVYLLTGYHPDISFLRRVGVEVADDSWKPTVDSETLESNVAGIYLAGSVMCGRTTTQIFIENGRLDATRIIPALKGSLAQDPR